jgi:tetratricopeptide (TPR) repeat protein
MAPQIRTLISQIKQSLSQFPSISRFITEKISIPQLVAAKVALACLLSLLLLCAIVNQSLTLKNNLKDLSQITQERQNIQKEIAYLEKESEKHKAYADIYLKIASLEYRLGNTKNSSIFLEKAFAIDPYTEQGRVLGEYITR